MLPGDEIDITCAFTWEGGRTFRIVQRVRKADGTVAAEITAVGGLLDSKTRKLVAAPEDHFEELAPDPALFGL